MKVCIQLKSGSKIRRGTYSIPETHGVHGRVPDRIEVPTWTEPGPEGRLDVAVFVYTEMDFVSHDDDTLLVTFDQVSGPVPPDGWWQ